MKTYLKAQEEITLLREKRTAGSKKLDDINRKLDELVHTLNVSEALLRLKELTGVIVSIGSGIECSCRMRS